MIKTVFTVKKAGLFLGFIISLLSVVSAEASHLRAGQITVVRRNCFSREFVITVRVYTNTGSPVVFGGDGILSFGDGNTKIVPEVPNTPRPDLGPNIGVAEFQWTYTYGGVGRYTISYVEPNRNGGVLNMDNSFYTTFYLETQIDLSIANCNYPTLQIDPIDQACTGVAFSHNPGAVDRDASDSLSYELAVPFRDRGLPVVNYRDPKTMSFNNENSGPPTFSIDPVNGTLVWDAPGVPGEYNVAFHVNEWKKINGIWTKVGYVRRDMQIIVNDDCDNERPRLIVPADTCVVAGSTITKWIEGTDAPEHHPIKIQAFSEVFSLATSPATRTPVLLDIEADNNYRPSPDKILFNWNTVCAHVKGTPYQVNLKITDKPPLGVKLATYATWQISVVAPAPVLTVATPVFPQRHVNLTWDSYECSANASAIQIWRKVGETNYVPGNCDTGMPESLGFTLVGTTSTGTATAFTDTNNGKGLEPGAQYCYRLVAIFHEQGAESYVSNEICIDPIKTSAPIITKVSVVKTGDTDGEITVNWIDPLDQTGFSPPYAYELQRVTGSGFVNVHTGQLSTHTYTEAGLDTRDQQYTYRLKVYSSNNKTDSSSLASSVWLDLTTGTGIINLDWRANVPWSNQIQGYVHDIYRGPEGATTLADLTPYVTVDASSKGMTFSDNGQAPLVPLDTTQTYCYAVITRGGYGNDAAIPPPLENFSQINCAKPTISNPPCKPTLVAQVNSCDEYSDCDATIFSNVIKWERNAGACNTEVRSYNIYRSTTQNGIYTRIETGWIDTFYVDPNLNSPARCYRISAVDRSNNEGELSDPVCIETCPYYELPNMFSPNGDGCNDLFSAYGVDLQLDENSKCKPDPNDNYKCARFVEKVVFKVYNRWGTKVYEYTGQKNNENNIYINWNGRDSSGKELATAVYYYSADVTFDSTDPGGKVKTIKGWVHLMR